MKARGEAGAPPRAFSSYSAWIRSQVVTICHRLSTFSGWAVPCGADRKPRWQFHGAFSFLANPQEILVSCLSVEFAFVRRMIK